MPLSQRLKQSKKNEFPDGKLMGRFCMEAIGQHFKHSNCPGNTRRTFFADTGMGFTGLALGAMLFPDGVARFRMLKDTLVVTGITDNTGVFFEVMRVALGHKKLRQKTTNHIRKQIAVAAAAATGTLYEKNAGARRQLCTSRVRFQQSLHFKDTSRGRHTSALSKADHIRRISGTQM